MTVVTVAYVSPVSSYIVPPQVLKTWKVTLQGGESQKRGYLVNKGISMNYLQLDAKSNSDVTFQGQQR